MARLSLAASSGAQSPQTPTKGGHYHDLLAQFGSQSSSGSATKARRASTQNKTPTTQDQSALPQGSGERMQRSHQHANQIQSDTTANNVEQNHASVSRQTSSSSTITVQESTPHQTNRSLRSAKAKQEASGSEDELALSVPPTRKTSARIQAYTEDLKMERRKKERANVEGLRRGTRDRKSLILESDTMPSPPSTRRKAARPLHNMDSARSRLRNDIALKSKARANSFLVANKNLFLPLLPEHNQVAKLVKQGDAQPIINYEELSRQPEGVTATMKPYQLSGLSFLVHMYNNGFSSILGDEMGLGKTLQTLSLFQYLEELDQKQGVKSEELRPYLVVCPLSVLNSWVTEAQKWVPQLKVLRFHGAVTERARLKRVAVGMEDMKGHETSRARDRKASKKAGQKLSKLSADDHASESYKIFVTTYDTFQAEQSWFKTAFVWRYVVLDEGHKIKSSVTQISTALRNITSEYRLILTGTPLQNNLVEMWALLAWLYPDVFTDKTQSLFKESFDLNRGKVNRTTMDDARSLLELIMLRRMKDSPSVNLGLPPKEEVLLYVPLTPMQKLWYTRLLTRMDESMLNELFADGKTKEKAALKQDAQENDLFRQVDKLDKEGALDRQQNHGDETAMIMQEAIAKAEDDEKSKGAWQKLMNLVMQLRKCCSHPYLLPSAEPDPYYLGEHIVRASGKFILLEKLLKHTVFGQGKKVLIFSGFKRTLDLCEDLLSLISNRGEKFRHLRLDGSSARARRNLDIRLFNQEKSDYKVMLLSTRAGGLGINLTSAQDVIFLDEDWNPQITLQAEARAHRIGQTKKVTIYKLCTQGTVEEQMMGRIRKKLYLSAKITESMQNIHGTQAVTKTGKKGRPSLAEDMPQMDTTQLKTLVRRGAQTLSHPEIDANEMVSWDLDMMMAKCRDQSTDAVAVDGEHTEVDEEKWLSAMERVECAVFDGKRYQRQLDKDAKAATSAKNILPDEVTRADRRKGKNTTVMVDGYAVDKGSMNCGDWEAVPTMAGKDPRLAEPVREKRREFSHEQHCLACFEEENVGHMVECKSCPRAYHFDCLDGVYKSKVKGFNGFFCPQHSCSECGKNTTDAGGLIFRCRWCPQGFCEDCLDWNNTELVGDNLPEFELLGEAATQGGFYIKCPTCKESCEESQEQKTWMLETENNYKEQYDLEMQARAEAQKEIERHDATINADNAKSASNTQMVLPLLNSSPTKQSTCIIIADTETPDSPPSLTDTSTSTPVLNGSRVGTPKRTLPDEYAGEARKEKRSKLDAPVTMLK